MNYNEVTPYYDENKTHVAVLVSPGYGAGWSTWNEDGLAFDSRVVDWWLKHMDCNYEKEGPERDLFVQKLHEWGYDTPYFGGYKNVRLIWVNRDRMFRIQEYDGAEHIVFADEIGWYKF